MECQPRVLNTAQVVFTTLMVCRQRCPEPFAARASRRKGHEFVFLGQRNHRIEPQKKVRFLFHQILKLSGFIGIPVKCDLILPIIKDSISVNWGLFSQLFKTSESGMSKWKTIRSGRSSKKSFSTLLASTFGRFWRLFTYWTYKDGTLRSRNTIS